MNKAYSIIENEKIEIYRVSGFHRIEPWKFRSNNSIEKFDIKRMWECLVNFIKWHENKNL